MIIDTDVIIWYLKGNKNAFNIIEKQNGFQVSVITYMELVQGMRNKTELTELRKAFRVWKTKILYIDEEISSKAMFLVERYFLSHSIEVADALIACTSIVNGQPLLTGNIKHYKIITELDSIKFKL